MKLACFLLYMILYIKNIYNLKKKCFRMILYESFFHPYKFDNLFLDNLFLDNLFLICIYVYVRVYVCMYKLYV